MEDNVWSQLAALEGKSRAVQPSKQQKPKGGGRGKEQPQDASTDSDFMSGPFLPFRFVEAGSLGSLLVDSRVSLHGSPLDLPKNKVPSVSLNCLLTENGDSKELLAESFLPLTPTYRDDKSQAFADNRHNFIWGRPLLAGELFSLELSRPTTTLEVLSDSTAEGHVFKEIPLFEGEDKPTNSTSLLRAPGDINTFHKGNSSNYPFMPGGLSGEEEGRIIRGEKSMKTKGPGDAGQELVAVDFYEEHLCTVPPGFNKGLAFTPEGKSRIVPQGDTTVPKVVEKEKGAEVPPVQKEEAPAKPILSFETAFKGEGEELYIEKAKPEDSDSEEESEEETPPKKSEEFEGPLEGFDLDKVINKTTRPGDKGQSVKGEAEDDKNKHWAIMDNTDVSNFAELVPKMALEYPFDLDVFQKEAIYHLENGESVFVAAHTSAGKTVVAEYAIALAAKHMTRAVYTSPIKALSNQKFRDFKETFGDVGLITGDIQIHPEASCLILTTEILRSMLYKGADLIRDVEWVIFDEVHYVNDLERGVVWEEVIIMLPAHVNLILLSATVPNTFEFADWIGRTKKKNIYVISTLKRPVPLEHYLYATGDLHKIVDPKGTFLTRGYQTAINALKEKQAKAGKKFGRGGGDKQQRGKWIKLIDLLLKKKLLPVVVFAFSKKKCEQVSHSLTTMDLTTSTEKHEIHMFIEKALARLKGSDKRLPQILRIRDLLKRGIGVHHGGLLPIIKEMVEILFGRGKIKVLFATETFAMGVNMPARTVVFENTRKHDGRAFRDLLSGEYIQMSGRAGRRGLDTVGTVIIITNEENIPDSSSLHKMILGTPQKLESQFRLTYNMILNLLRVQDFKVEDMMKRSFSEFSTQRSLPEQKLQLVKHEEMLKTFTDVDCIFGEPDIEPYYHLATEEAELDTKIHRIVLQTRNALQTLITGRLISIKNQELGNTLGVVLQVAAKDSRGGLFSGATEVAIEDRYFYVIALDPKITQGVSPGRIVKIHLFDINEIYTQKFKDLDSTRFIPISIANPRDVSLVAQRLLRVQETHTKGTQLGATAPSGKQEASSSKGKSKGRGRGKESNEPRGGKASAGRGRGKGRGGEEDGGDAGDEEGGALVPFHPINDFKLYDLDFAEMFSRREYLREQMNKSKCHTCPKLQDQWEKIEKEEKVRREIDMLRFQLSNENLALMPEFQTRVKILKFLNYIDENNTVLLKGRVARELNTVKDELISTELILENALTDLPPEEIVAVLSCLIFELKTESEPRLTESLQATKKRVIGLTENLLQMQLDMGLDINPKDYMRNVNFGLVEVVYEWARGMPFSDITQLTDVAEGSIVRTITRLDETCKEIRNAARIIGNSVLFAKTEEASRMIKRDIVFAASLYYE